MKRKKKQKRAPSADEVAKRVDNGEDVSDFFDNRGRMVIEPHKPQAEQPVEN
jgi:hypothetical protein